MEDMYCELVGCENCVYKDVPTIDHYFAEQALKAVLEKRHEDFLFEKNQIKNSDLKNQIVSLVDFYEHSNDVDEHLIEYAMEQHGECIAKLDDELEKIELDEDELFVYPNDPENFDLL